MQQSASVTYWKLLPFQAHTRSTIEMAGSVRETAAKFLDFINKTPSPYHVVEECKKLLAAAGFKELKETQSWTIKPLDKYFVTRNHSTIIAFAVGGKYTSGNGFTIAGAHTDSPCLKVKPHSARAKDGYLQVGVECYGGGIWHTWFDRDLTVAGRCVVKVDGQLEHRLVQVDKPILRVPNICIHLMRDHNEKFSPNKETHICPVLCTEVTAQLGGANGKAAGPLMQLLCDKMSIEKEQLLDYDLHLADTHPAAFGGLKDEFIFSPRLDNLFNVYTSIAGLTDSLGSLESEANIRMVCCFDNEEVGSESAQGAGSTLLELILRRLASSTHNPLGFEESMPRSFMLSADQAHAVHPNYSEKHEGKHSPSLHGGIVMKVNANQRYASTAMTQAVVREIAAGCGVPMQDFVVRNDSPCGSTIGPIMSAKLGMPTCDIGGPQLSMHSIREMCSAASVLQAYTLYKAYFEQLPRVAAMLQ